MSGQWNTCIAGDCGKSTQTKNGDYCPKHATRVARHDDPFAFTHQRDRNLPRGDRNVNWTGSDATYDAMHQRVEAQRGKASVHPCADCGKPAQHWSYDHSDPDERISGIGCAYSLNVDHYLPRCVSCHRRFDSAALREAGRIGPAPRCGKPMEIRSHARQVSEPGAAPICGRPEGHTGPCRSMESYRRNLARNRSAA